MGRPRAPHPSIGPLAHPTDDPRRNKPSWFSLGGYFKRKDGGKRAKVSSSWSQQTYDMGMSNRGSGSPKDGGGIRGPHGFRGTKLTRELVQRKS